MLRNIFLLLTAAPLLALGSQAATGDTTTPSLRKAMAALKLDAEALQGVEKELNVPKAWIDGAKKEGKVRVNLNIRERAFDPIAKAFSERYPGVTVDYSRKVGRSRAMDPLLAFKRGTYLTDVVYGFDTLQREFEDAKALIDLRNLPAFASIPSEAKDPKGLSVGFTLTYWCLAYNTNKVKESELPRTWDDLITSTRFRNGKVGMGNRPNLWLSNLWGVKGTKWTEDYMKAIFTTLKPQLRKESQSGLMTLLNLGEFELTIPSYPDGIERMAKKGAKISFHCPEPVPAAYNSFGIFRNNPHINASKLFVNWYLSKEGQIIANYAARLLPAHKDMQKRKFIPYYDTIFGKQQAPFTQRVLDEVPTLVKKWNVLWQNAGRK